MLKKTPLSLSALLCGAALTFSSSAQETCKDTGSARPKLVEYEVNWRNPLHLEGLEADVVKLRIGGGGKAVLVDLQVGRLVIKQGGGSQVSVSGAAQSLEADVSGGSRFNAFELRNDKIKANVSGGARAFLLAEGSLQVNASGSATVTYRGEPSHLRKHVSGSAKLLAEVPQPRRSAEELRRLDSLQRTLAMRMTFAAQPGVVRH